MSIWARVSVLVAFLAVLMPLVQVVSVPSASAATEDPIVKAAMVQLVQGEVDTTTAEDAYNDFYALKIITYLVVPGDTRVWTGVPTDARNLLVWTSLGEAGSGSYGWESAGPMAGSFFVDIPSSFNYSSGEFLIHVSYSWTQDFKHGRTTIDVSEPSQFAANGTFVLMAYVLKSYNVTGVGLGMVFDSAGAMSYYPDKDLYLNASTPFDPSTIPAIIIAKPKTSTPWALYIGAAAIGVVLVLVFAYARYVRPAARAVPNSERRSLSAAAAAPRSDPSRKKELVDRKKKMLSEIATIKDGLSKGTVQREDAEKELVRLRKEYKSIRNELNRIARTARPAEIPISAVASDSKRSDEFELILASLAKIDEDYEKGRLPEGSYRSLRKDYLEKASDLMDKGGTQLENVDPSEAEKVKLMEAIVAMDEEHDRGEIEGRVYEDLRASYKNELAELMKKGDD